MPRPNDTHRLSPEQEAVLLLRANGWTRRGLHRWREPRKRFRWSQDWALRRQKRIDKEAQEAEAARLKELEREVKSR